MDGFYRKDDNNYQLNVFGKKLVKPTVNYARKLQMNSTQAKDQNQQLDSNSPSQSFDIIPNANDGDQAPKLKDTINKLKSAKRDETSQSSSKTKSGSTSTRLDIRNAARRQRRANLALQTMRNRQASLPFQNNI